MATNILMPALSPTMTEGTLARWLKKEGERVRSGDVIAEIETDKATMEVEAVDEGVLGKILVPDGTEGVQVNAPIGVLVQPGESPLPRAGEVAPAQAAAGEGLPAADPHPAPKPAPTSPAGGRGESEPKSPLPPAGAGEGARHNGHDGEFRLFASPLARRMALQAGIDLRALTGSGPNGRIVKADVEAALGKARAAPAATPAPAPVARPPAPAPAITAPHRLLPNSGVRKIIARRLTEAKQTIPHFYVSMDIALDALLALRGQLNGRSPNDGPGAFRLSVNDLLIKAAAIALRRVPGVNASFTEEAIVLYDDIDISIAVSIADGLITPILRRADQKGLAAISNEMKALIERAKAGKLKPEEFQGGGFSISNMGMYGVTEFAAVINPPQAAILAVGAGEQRAVVREGQVVVATMMTATLSVDHRVIDGALAASWLTAFKTIVEDPLGLML